MHNLRTLLHRELKIGTVVTIIKVNIFAKFGYVTSYQSPDLKFCQKRAITQKISYFEHYLLHEICKLTLAINISDNQQAFTFQRQKTPVKNLFLIKSYVKSKQCMFFDKFFDFRPKFQNFSWCQQKLGACLKVLIIFLKRQHYEVLLAQISYQ